MLSEEEKKAMKYFYNFRATIDESIMLFDEDLNVKCGKETIYQITTILNLIEKQQAEIEKWKELANKNLQNEIIFREKNEPEDIFVLQAEIEKKDKIIDKMGQELFIEIEPHFDTLEQCIEFYTNKVEEENK